MPLPGPVSCSERLVMRKDLAPYFTNTETEELIHHFRTADADASGAIDEAELATLFRILNVLISDRDLGNLVEAVDIDQNGLIDFDEFVMVRPLSISLETMI